VTAQQPGSRRANVERVERTLSKQARSRLEAERRADLAAVGPEVARRPTVRAECLPGGRNEARPCPYASCGYHLAYDVTGVGNLRRNHPDLDLWELNETCALDVADLGGVTLEVVSQATHVSRERIRQIEDTALAKLAAAHPHAADWIPTPKGEQVMPEGGGGLQSEGLAKVITQREAAIRERVRHLRVVK